VYLWAYSFSILGHALNQDAIQKIRQILDEHGKRKRPVALHVYATYAYCTVYSFTAACLH